MALILGELAAILKTDNSRLKRGLDEGERDVRASGRRMERDTTATGRALETALGQSGRAAGQALGDGITRGADGRLRDARGRFIRAGQELGSAASGGARGGLDSLRQALGNFGSGVTNVVTNVWNLIPVILGLGAAATFAVPSVYLLGGALASLPALAAGGGAAIGALAIGFMGLSDAFKKTSSAGGAVVDKAWQVAQAERRVRDANREVLAATEALNRARQRAAENLQDLTRNLASAHLDEESAVLAVAEAQRDLEEARRGGDALEIARAELAYRQAQQAVEDVKDRVEDLTAEHKAATVAGVEGSDEVRDALDRQRRAIESVEDAQHALREAQKPPPGGGGAAQELMRLAPAAAEVVRVIKSLKPAWESLRLDVQQRLFAGVGREIRLLAAAWLPTLHERLGGMATTFNGIFRLFSRSARRPEFIANIAAGMESVQRLIDRVGRSLAGPFMDAFGRLSRAATPFIDALGDEIGDLVDDFSAWIKSADESGALKDFMGQATNFLRDVFDMGRDVGSIFGSIMQILFEEKDVSTSPWVGLRDSLDDVAAWFKDPENQERVREWIDRIKEFATWLFTDGLPTVASWIEKIDSWVTKAEEWGGRIVAFKDGIVGAFNSVVAFFGGLPGRISKVTSGMWDGIKAAFRSAVNWIIDRWNNLSLTVGGGSIMGVGIPSVTLNTPNIPHLATGGDVLQSGMAVIHKGERVVPAAKVDRSGAGGGLSGTLRVVLQWPDGRVIRDQLVDAATLRGQSTGRYLGVTPA